MASPKNWQRWKEKENRSTPYVWVNTSWYDDHNMKRIEVIENLKGNKSKGYAVRIRGNPDKGTKAKIMDGYSNKQDARKKAVKWMEKHPNP